MNPYFAVGAIISGIGLFMGGMGLMTTLVPLLMREAGYSATQIGFIASGFSAGFLLGCIWAPRLVQRIGHIRAFSAFAALMSASTLAFAIGADLILWTALRLVMGVSLAGLLTVSDSWITGETEKSLRGRVLGVYMVIYKLMQGAGPLVLTLGEITGHWPIMLASAAFSLSLLPVAMRNGGNPTAPSDARMGIRDVYRLSPLAFVGCICLGMSNSPLVNLNALYAADIGLGTAGIATAAAALQVGALLLQWPMGWASDRTDRRYVMIFGTAVVAGTSLLIALLPPLPLVGLVPLLAVTGGFSMSVYPVVVAHAGDFTEPDRMVPLCATLMLAFAVGMTVGPVTASYAMQMLGPPGLFFHTALFALAFIAWAAFRMTRRRSRPVDGRPAYVNLPATSTSISQLDPRAPYPDIAESLEEAFGQDPDDPEAPPERPHYAPSER